MASRMAPSIRRSRSEGVISPRSACSRKVAQMCWSAASTVSTVITVPTSMPGIPPGMPGRVRGFGPHCGPTLLPHEGSAPARAPRMTRGTSTRPLCFWSGVPASGPASRLLVRRPGFWSGVPHAAGRSCVRVAPQHVPTGRTIFGQPENAPDSGNKLLVTGFRCSLGSRHQGSDVVQRPAPPESSKGAKAMSFILAVIVVIILVALMLRRRRR